MSGYDVQWDDTFGLGLHYMNARHYSPLLGRFLQPDPSRRESNAYAYARSSPTSYVDPCGLEAVCPQELWFCGNPVNWYICALAQGARLSAERMTKQNFPWSYGSDGTRANAYKHCAWSAGLAYFIGWQAQGFGDRHESCQPWWSAHRLMDLWNNRVGRGIGFSLGWQWTPWSAINRGCLTALNAGRLAVIR